MTESLLSLHDRLRPDPWRMSDGFSDDLAVAQMEMFEAASSVEVADTLRTWLRSHQPCLFGRFAAKERRMTICALREDDLTHGDEHVAEVIRDHRQAWRVAALDGREHSFVITAVTERLAYATPGRELLDFARRLLALYLEGEGVDQVVFDRLFLRIGSAEPTFRVWANGVNVFAAQGDKRWWRDHRIPGGLAFAMNAVGHMARTYVVRERPTTGVMPPEEERGKLLNWALPVAMLTIRQASKSPPGRAGSWLLPKEEAAGAAPFCSETFRDLVGFDWRKYAGAFHTDHTIPSPFFEEAVDRPERYTDHLDLDFSYLHDPREQDHRLIGTGEAADPGVNEVLRALLASAQEGKHG
jgi:hypothetical protein